MDRETKKLLEGQFGRAFIEEFEEIRFKQFYRDDCPDFFVEREKLTGLELTQIYNSTSTGVIRSSVEGSRDSLVSQLKKMWDARELPACHVNLRFTEPIPIYKRNINPLANCIIELIKRYIPEKGAYFDSPDWLEINVKNLTGFAIERIVEYDTSIWTYSDTIWSPTLEPFLVQEVIDRKEEKRKKYLKRCIEIWLVIVIYGGRLSGDFIIPDGITDHYFESEFDRLFLFDAIPGRIIELNSR